MTFSTKAVVWAGVAAMHSAAVGVSHAASIDWGTPFEFVSDADIVLPGPVAYALNAGDTTNNPNILLDPSNPPASPIVVNVGGRAIAFEGLEAVYGEDASFGQLGFPFETFGDATTNLPGSGANVTFAVTDARTVDIPQVSIDKLPTTTFADEGRVYDVPTGNAELDVVLNSQVFADTRAIGSGALNMSLNNLEAGKDYQVQIIGAADSRVSGNLPSVSTLDDGAGGAVSGLSGFADLDEDGSFHVTSVIGTFTADATSQVINAVLEDKRNHGISALILTEVAEFLAADFDASGSVEQGDLNLILTNWGTETQGVAPSGWVNFDASTGIIDQADLNLVLTNWGSASPPSFAGSAVPEPAAFGFLGVASIALLRRRG